MTPTPTRLQIHGAFETAGRVREGLADLADVAADIEDPAFSLAVMEARDATTRIGNHLARLLTPEGGHPE